MNMFTQNRKQQMNLFRKQTKGKAMMETTAKAIRRQDKITPPNPQLSLNLSYVSAAWILIGLLIFLSNAVFDISEIWNKLYFLWDKGKDVLLLGTIYYAIPQSRPVIAPVWLFLAIRLCAEILTISTTISTNSTWITSSLFWLCSAAATYLTFRQLIKEWKSRY